MTRKKNRRTRLRLQVDHDSTTALQRAREVWDQLQHPRTLVALSHHELWGVLREHSADLLDLESYALSEGHLCLEGVLTDHVARERLKEFATIVDPDFYASAVRAAEADWKPVFKALGITRAKRREYETVRSQSQDWVQRACEGSPAGSRAHDGTNGSPNIQALADPSRINGSQAPRITDAQRFVLARSELRAICWNFFLHIDRNGVLDRTEHWTEEQFDAELDDAVAFAVECVAIGLAP